MTRINGRHRHATRAACGACSSRASSWSMSAGLVRWASKPVSCVRRRSSCCPYPVMAMMRTSRPHSGCRICLQVCSLSMSDMPMSSSTTSGRSVAPVVDEQAASAVAGSRRCDRRRFGRCHLRQMHDEFAALAGTLRLDASAMEPDEAARQREADAEALAGGGYRCGCLREHLEYLR